MVHVDGDGSGNAGVVPGTGHARAMPCGAMPCHVMPPRRNNWRQAACGSQALTDSVTLWCRLFLSVRRISNISNTSNTYVYFFSATIAFHRAIDIYAIVGDTVTCTIVSTVTGIVPFCGHSCLFGSRQSINQSIIQSINQSISQ